MLFGCLLDVAGRGGGVILSFDTDKHHAGYGPVKWDEDIPLLGFCYF